VWFRGSVSVDSSAKHTTKKHEHKTNPHESAQVAYELSILLPLKRFPFCLTFPITRLKPGVNETLDLLFVQSHYSYRNESTGSTFVARLPGM